MTKHTIYMFRLLSDYMAFTREIDSTPCWYVHEIIMSFDCIYKKEN